MRRGGHEKVVHKKTRWGGYDTITHDEDALNGRRTKLKRLFIDPYHNISYQRHEQRGENWAVLQGSGVLALDGNLYEIEAGNAINIAQGAWHSVKAHDYGLEIAEVQAGEECRETDIDRLYYDWEDIESLCDGGVNKK